MGIMIISIKMMHARHEVGQTDDRWIGRRYDGGCMGEDEMNNRACHH